MAKERTESANCPTKLEGDFSEQVVACPACEWVGTLYAFIKLHKCAASRSADEGTRGDFFAQRMARARMRQRHNAREIDSGASRSAGPDTREEEAREWCYQNGFHDCGDFHVQFDNGGVIDLPEILASFVASLRSSGPTRKEFDWSKEPDELLAELKYIASSPAQEHGGFHPRVVAAAQGAIARIEAARSSGGRETDALDEKQKKLVAWGTECFGAEHMADSKVRALRLLEEAIEFAQSVEAPIQQCRNLVDYIYGRPAGDPKQELGGIGVTWLVAAESLNVAASDALKWEMDRIAAKPSSHFNKRNAAKLEAGFTGATPTPSATKERGEEG